MKWNRSLRVMRHARGSGRSPASDPLVAIMIVASIGNGAAFHKGREFAAWLGLVPKWYSTGGKAKLYGIRKRGNNYLRKILIRRGTRRRVAIQARANREGRGMDELA